MDELLERESGGQGSAPEALLEVLRAQEHGDHHGEETCNGTHEYGCMFYRYYTYILYTYTCIYIGYVCIRDKR